MMNSKRNRKNVQALGITARRTRVADLLLEGVPYRDIAIREGVSLGTVASDKAAIMAEWKRESIDSLHEHIILQLRRLEALICKLSNQMEDTVDPRVGALYLQVLKRKAELLGLDARDRVRAPIDFPKSSIPEEQQDTMLDANGRPVGKGAAAQLFAILGRRSCGDSCDTDIEAHSGN